ncbi:MAG: hypothetical protein IPM48_11345 [Saprospiraceae bacterium]|nr:hypothetical protein [Saprospiraceae bacterium]
MTTSGAFKILKPSEYQELVLAIPKIAILIAGADGQIDFKEKAWAEKIIGIRSFAYTHELKPIYQELKEQFGPLLSKMLEEYPNDHITRNKQISKELMILNGILPKLKLYVASQYYDSLIDFAEEVAKASGGFLRMGAVSTEENVWLGLPMLDPIFYDELFEEE